MADKDAEKTKFQACVFLGNLHKKKHSEVVDKLNNPFPTGHDHCPAAVDEAASMTSIARGIDRMDHENDFEANGQSGPI